MVCELLTAIMTLSTFATSIITTNQRCDSRSYRTRGSEVPAERTELKKLSVELLSAPTFPFLSKTLIRPFTHTRNCVGPTAPCESGGTNPDSVEVAPIQFGPSENGPPLPPGPFGPPKISAIGLP